MKKLQAVVASVLLATIFGSGVVTGQRIDDVNRAWGRLTSTPAVSLSVDSLVKQEIRLKVGYLSGDGMAYCSAVKITPTLVLTAAHCMGPANAGIVYDFHEPVTGQNFKAAEVKRHEGVDLALLKVAGNMPGPYANLADKIEINEKTYAVGFPLGDILGNTQILTEGLYQGVMGSDPHLTISTSPIIYGNSGGALFDANGNLVGITVAGILLPNAGQINHLSLSVHLDVIKEFLK